MAASEHTGNAVSPSPTETETETETASHPLPFGEDHEKDLRAATESMTTHSLGNSTWDVYSGTKATRYTVFAFGGLAKWKCECPDHHYRQATCKHIRRVQMVLGLRDIPETDSASRTDVEVMIDAHKRVAARRAARNADDEREVPSTVSGTSTEDADTHSEVVA